MRTSAGSVPAVRTQTPRSLTATDDSRGREPGSGMVATTSPVTTSTRTRVLSAQLPSQSDSKPSSMARQISVLTGTEPSSSPVSRSKRPTPSPTLATQAESPAMVTQSAKGTASMA